MNRRDFIKKAASSTAVLAASSSMLGMSSIAQAGNDYDWALGWKSIEQYSISALSMDVQGDLPSTLNGLFMRNGPAKLQRDDQRYTHWFDGDGMIQQFAIEQGNVSHSGRFVQTEKYVEEEAAQRFIYNAAGTTFDDALNGRNNDTANTANTALLHWDDELLALWEGGSAYSLDTHTSQTKGLKTWHNDLKHMPFSAHPLIDQTGDMWNFGFAPYAGKNGKIVVYRISPQKGVQQTQLIDLPFSGYMHDFAQTKKSLVFFVPPYTFTNGNGKSFVTKFEWREQLGGRLLVVDKNDLSQQQWFELPAGFVFHFGHASEQNNMLQVNLCWYKNANLMTKGMVELMQSGVNPHAQYASAATIVADKNTGQAQLVQSDTLMEFPIFDEAKVNKKSPIFGVGKGSANSPHSDKLINWSAYAGEQDSNQYPQGLLVEEPMLVPKQTNGNTGKQDLIVQTFLDVKQKRSGLNVFHADSLKQGPIAQASMNRTIPLGFHGTFVG